MTDTVPTDELLPCPFCGGSAKAPVHYNGAMETGCAGDYNCPGTDVLVPIAAWNRRTPPASAKNETGIEPVAWDAPSVRAALAEHLCNEYDVDFCPIPGAH